MKITTTTTREYTVAQIKDMMSDIDKSCNPRHLMTYNDGYFAKSLEQKWHMGISEMKAVVKAYKTSLPKTMMSLEEADAAVRKLGVVPSLIWRCTRNRHHMWEVTCYLEGVAGFSGGPRQHLKEAVLATFLMVKHKMRPEDRALESSQIQDA
jgi:hypothetical protein